MALVKPGREWEGLQDFRHHLEVHQTCRTKCLADKTNLYDVGEDGGLITLFRRSKIGVIDDFRNAGARIKVDGLFNNWRLFQKAVSFYCYEIVCNIFKNSQAFWNCRHNNRHLMLPPLLLTCGERKKLEGDDSWASLEMLSSSTASCTRNVHLNPLFI